MACSLHALGALLLTLIINTPLKAAMQSTSSFSATASSSAMTETNLSKVLASPSKSVAQPNDSVTATTSADSSNGDSKEERKASGQQQLTDISSLKEEPIHPAFCCKRGPYQPEYKTSLSDLSRHFVDLATPYPQFTCKDERLEFFHSLNDMRVPGDVYATFSTTMATFKDVMMQELSVDDEWVDHKGLAPQDLKTFRPYVQVLHIKTADEQTFLPLSDIHGDGTALMAVLDDLIKNGQLSADYKLLEPTLHLIFLGDYSDRNPFGIEVWHIIMQLKIANPTKVFILRGNHESLSQNKKKSEQFWFMSEVEHKLYAATQDVIDNLYNHLPLALYVTNDQQTALFCHGFPDPRFDPSALLNDEKASYMHITSANYNKEPLFTTLTASQQTASIAAIIQAQRQSLCFDAVDALVTCVDACFAIANDIHQHIDHKAPSAAIIETVCKQEYQCCEEFDRVKNEPMNAITAATTVNALLPHFEPLERCIQAMARYNHELLEKNQTTETANEKDVSTSASISATTQDSNTVKARSTTYQTWLKKALRSQENYTNLKKQLLTIMENDNTRLNTILPKLLCQPTTYADINATLKLEIDYPLLFPQGMLLDHTIFNLRSAIPTSIDTPTTFAWLDYDMKGYCSKKPQPTHNSCMSYDPVTSRTALGRELVRQTLHKHNINYVIRGHQHGGKSSNLLTKANGIHVSGKKNKNCSYYLENGDVVTVVTGRGPWILPTLENYSYCTITFDGNKAFLEKMIDA